MASHRELVQYQKSLCGQSEILRFPLGPLGIPDMKFLEIPKDFLIDHLIGEEVEITDSRGKVQRVREGKTIKDIRKLTGAEILFIKGNQGKHKEAFSTLFESLVQMTCSDLTNFLKLAEFAIKNAVFSRIT